MRWKEKSSRQLRSLKAEGKGDGMIMGIRMKLPSGHGVKREARAWSIQTASDPLRAFIFRGIELGFETPLRLEFRDANGHGFTQTIHFDDAGKLVDADDPEFLDGTSGDDSIVTPCMYTLMDARRTKGIEVLMDPKPVN